MGYYTLMSCTPVDEKDILQDLDHMVIDKRETTVQVHQKNACVAFER